MLYLLAFVLGGFARTIPRCLLYALVAMLLYSALIFAVAVPALREGATSVPFILGGLGVDWAVGFAVALFGYLCRLVVIGQRAPPEDARKDEVTKTFE